MGKSGKTDKKVKSERINALRKQYDSFLEEDRRRKERNDYILGRLDTMRSSDQLVTRCYRNPVQIKDDPAVRPMRKGSELQLLKRNYSIEPYHPTPRNADELDLLRLISKNYILIPKLEQRSNDPHDFIPENKTPTPENDWKSKYDILTQLKKDEKESNGDSEKVTEIGGNAKNYKFDDYLAVDNNNDELPKEFKQRGTEIPERDSVNNNIAKYRNETPYSRVTKDIIKPVETIALKVTKDTTDVFDNTYSNKKHNQSPPNDLDTVHLPVKDTNINVRHPQSEQAILTEVSQTMKQTYSDNVLHSERHLNKTNTTDENYVGEPEASPIKITNPINSVVNVDMLGVEIKQTGAIHQDKPILADDQVYHTDDVHQKETEKHFTMSDEASTQQEVYVHSPDDGNTVQQEYKQEQVQYLPKNNAGYENGSEIPQSHQENEQAAYLQELNVNNPEYDQHVNAVGYNTAEVDNPQNYDKNGQVNEEHYEKDVQDGNYDQSEQGVDANYDQHPHEENYSQETQALNYEQSPQDSTYPESTDYDQTSLAPVYGGDQQEHYTDDQTYEHSENYPDQGQLAGENYDQNYSADGVYQPDTSYATDQVLAEGQDQTYAEVQNQPITYDHDITQQQYDQTYAEQYGAQDQQEQLGQPQQPYQQEYDQVYDEFQQDNKGTVEGVQQQLDAEDGYVEQNPPEQ